MNKDIWEMAEDTFLDAYCEVTTEQRYYRYLWSDGGNWGKFNFIRLTDPEISKEDLLKICDENRSSFSDCDKTISIKSNFEMDKFDFLEEAGIPIVSIQLPILPEVDFHFELRLCEDEEAMISWWAVNSDGRDREGKSPLFPVISKMRVDPKNKFYILKKGDETLACGATSYFDDQFNLWGLATRKEHQRNGYMRDLVREISKKEKKPFTVQVNIDSESYKYFSNIEGMTVINTEKRYIEKS